MGNCQAVDAAALVIQHPCGKMERMYWPVTVSEVMKRNPGHYVSLIIPLPISGGENVDEKVVRFTRVKLLRPNETLVLGRAYRLVTTQEVMKVLQAKRNAKTRKDQPEPQNQSINCEAEAGRSELNKTTQAIRHKRYRQKPGTVNFSAGRSKMWRPSLQSISEGAS
ncbi:hypothetical protein NMG60_11030741 [Bertholletia excelsa]